MVDANLFNKAWTTLYAVISGDVPDPINRGNKWIFAANPLIDSGTTPGLKYPIIVIEPFRIDSQEPISFGTNIMETNISTNIEVHDNVGGSRFDAICSNVQSAIWNNADEFMKSGLSQLSIDGGIYDSIYFSRNNRLHIRSFGLNLTSSE